MGYRYPQKKKQKKVPIKIQGLGTFYIARKWLLISAGIMTIAIIGLAEFLIWIQTVRICNFLYPC